MSEYFNWPANNDELVRAWNDADQIMDADSIPEWLESDEYGTIRYLCNSSWANIRADDQSQYFAELDECPDGIIRDYDLGDGCVTHFYIQCPDGCEPDWWQFMDRITTLAELIDSDECDANRFGSSSDDWLNDADRMQRCHDASEFGSDGSTHGEIIQDWRDLLDNYFDDLSEQTRESIHAEIDECEQWHVNNGSIDQQIG